jgi:RNA polymerase sigma factor (TIGR02999 family)
LRPTGCRRPPARVYDELRKLASQRLAIEKPGQTLQPTAPVHEAYLRLVGHRFPTKSPAPSLNGRGHFLGAAAEAMRRILIDHARRKLRPKHGGDRERVALDDLALPADELLALDESLSSLARVEPAKAELVKLRYFAGLTLADRSESAD